MAATKQDAAEIERASPVLSLTHSQEKEPIVEALDDDPVYTYEEQRKIIHRLDWRLITVAGIIYMNSLMDRANLPNAAIAGMNEDLDMMDGYGYVCASQDVDTTPFANIWSSLLSPLFSSSPILSSNPQQRFLLESSVHDPFFQEFVWLGV